MSSTAFTTPVHKTNYKTTHSTATAIWKALPLFDKCAVQGAVQEKSCNVPCCCCSVRLLNPPIISTWLIPSSLSVLSGMCLIYLPWYYKNVIIKPYHNFPEPVAKKLRKALFYSRGKYLDIREANKFFRQALQTADELGMDPFSDEIMGVKYTIAALFEDAGYYSLATDVLEIMRADTQKWMEEFSHKHWNDGNRARVLKNLIQINIKLGQLYDIKYVNEPENGGRRLVEAVETALAETQRREKNGLYQGEGDFLTNEELGGALEALGSHYEEFGPRYLATPLFVKALELCPPKSCHSIILSKSLFTCENIVQMLIVLRSEQHFNLPQPAEPAPNQGRACPLLRTHRFPRHQRSAARRTPRSSPPVGYQGNRPRRGDTFHG